MSFGSTRTKEYEEMQRISSDYISNREANCEICHRRMFKGMYIFNVELASGRKGVAHSLCEVKKTE